MPMPAKPKKKLSDADLEAILCEIAQTSGSAIARIQAVKELRNLRAERGGEAPPSGFDELDGQEKPRLKVA
jgi:hypothetical protein